MKFYGINWIKFIDSPVKLKVVKFLAQNKADLSEREIASIVKVSHMSVNRILRALAKVNFTYSAVVGTAHVWRVNRSSYAFKILSTLMEQETQTRDPLESLKGLILEKLPKEIIVKVVLFGSIAHKSEHENSDIDLFVMAKSENGKPQLEQWLNAITTKCLELYGNRFAPYVLSQWEFEKKQDLGVIKEIEKGIVIYPPDQERKE